MALTVSTLETVDELQRLEPEWRELLARMGADLPFLWPEWTITWWEFFRQERSAVRDSLQAKTVRGERGELLAIVPLMRTERPGVGPALARTMGFLGADKYVTEQRAPIIDRTCQREVAEALAGDLRGRNSWDWITWEGLAREGEFAAALGRDLNLRWHDSQPANILRLAPSWEEFRQGLKHNIKESLRHCYNSLKRTNLVPRLEVAVSPEEIVPALEVFFRLHTARSLQSNGQAHPDRFATSTLRQFLERVCLRFAERRMARVFTLRVGETAVASRVGFMLPGCLYLYYSGFDPEWGKYSVATTVLAEALKHAIESGCSTAHLSMGADVSKSRWGPEMPMFHRAVWVRPELYSRLALSVYSFARNDAGPLARVRGVLGRRFG
jgi:CelD/BcsL family acetyltransferase involved in cellulose biosynthesis